MNSFENIKPDTEKEVPEMREQPVETTEKKEAESGTENISKVDTVGQDAIKLEQARAKIERISDDGLNEQESAGDERGIRLAKGYMNEDGTPLTVDEIKNVSDEFGKKLKTKFMTKFGLWTDFEKRRKLDKYFLKSGYRVSRRGGGAV